MSGVMDVMGVMGVPSETGSRHLFCYTSGVFPFTGREAATDRGKLLPPGLLIQD